MLRAGIVVTILGTFPGAAIAQSPNPPGGRCQMDVHSNGTMTSNQLPSGQRNYVMSGGVVATCARQGMVLRSDSLESYGDEGRTIFIGHVDYRDPRLKLKSDFLTYFGKEERIVATQNVVATLPSGSTLRGPQAEFLRAVPGVRQQQSATAIGRPTINLIQRDSLGRVQPPVAITANTVYLQGDSVVSAVGQVVVVRPELTAVGDSLYADQGIGLLRMMRQPRITGTKGRSFTLDGETIDLHTRARKLERVLAKNSARAHSQDIDLRADSIDLRIANDLLQRAIAWGKGRAHATSPTQLILADSMDVLLPAQHLRELRALRGAVAEDMPDTSRYKARERDRLTGDTIVAYFDSLATEDTSTKPQIRFLESKGHATSLKHVPPRDTSLCLPEIHYVRGAQIAVTFDSAQVSTVKVHDPVESEGIRVEPTATAEGARCGAAAGPSVQAKPSATRQGVAGAAPSASAVGCYAVRSSANDSTRTPYAPAGVIALGPGRDTAYATDGYEVHPGPPGPRRSLSAAAWWPVGRDSVRVWWNTGFEHWTVRLPAAGDTLRGTVDYQNDGDGFAHHVRPITVVRRPCVR